VLHFDAHADLRLAYEGFTWSHASILRNVVDRLPSVARVLQVGCGT
jgi:agmatinase